MCHELEVIILFFYLYIYWFHFQVGNVTIGEQIAFVKSVHLVWNFTEVTLIFLQALDIIYITIHRIIIKLYTQMLPIP